MDQPRPPAPAAAPSAADQARAVVAHVRAAGRARRRSPEEIALAGRLNGLLYVVAGGVTLLTIALPGGDYDAPGIVAAAALAGIVWGAVVLALPPWRTWPALLTHASSIIGLLLVAGLVPLTGGHDSPLEDLLFLLVIYTAFFYTPRQGAAYWALCGVVVGLPLLYDAGAVEANMVRDLAVTVPLFFVLGGIVVVGRTVLFDMRGEKGILERSERALAEQQSSLRRVATAVAAGAPPEGIFALVSSEAGRLLGARAAAIARFDVGGGHAMVMGGWSTPGTAAEPRVGTLYAVGAVDSVLGRVRLQGGAVREDDGDGDVLGVPARSVLAAPVHTGTRVWGALVAIGDAEPFAAGEGERLQEYADLIATAIANAEDRVLLQRHAGRDPLTDVLNRRAFHERLVEEVSRAQRHGRPLTVGVFDVDRFRELNDRVGVEAADAVLVEVAGRIRDGVRDEDVVARLVADRFAVIFPESDVAEALAAAERARAGVAEGPLRHDVHVTVSVGLCDLGRAVVAEDLVRHATTAMGRIKARGGDGVERFASLSRLPSPERVADDVDRSHALMGLRALARAIDAKQAATEDHSERVAALAARLAVVRGWDPRAVGRLREAALMHDVGKIGVPDAVLLKDGPLTRREREVAQEHAALSAHMVAGILEDDQVAWIAAHHERPDGAGYPLGLRDGIPEGAALLALADAWERLTRRATWTRGAKVLDDALAEIRAGAGRQFAPEAVAALEVLHERGELMLAAARVHAPGREVA